MRWDASKRSDCQCLTFLGPVWNDKGPSQKTLTVKLLFWSRFDHRGQTNFPQVELNKGRTRSDRDLVLGLTSQQLLDLPRFSRGWTRGMIQWGLRDSPWRYSQVRSGPNSSQTSEKRVKLSQTRGWTTSWPRKIPHHSGNRVTAVAAVAFKSLLQALIAGKYSSLDNLLVEQWMYSHISSQIPAQKEFCDISVHKTQTFCESITEPKQIICSWEAKDFRSHQQKQLKLIVFAVQRKSLEFTNQSSSN
jgi:hypothetical protein